MSRTCRVMLVEKADYVCVECGNVMKLTYPIPYNKMVVDHIIAECNCETMKGRKFKLQPRITQGVEVEDEQA